MIGMASLDGMGGGAGWEALGLLCRENNMEHRSETNDPAVHRARKATVFVWL